MVTINDFKLIGISVRTTNKNNQASKDIGQLWSRFYSENIFDIIPGKLGNAVYSVYTDYENDYTGAYTTIIGVPVASLNAIPEGMTGREFKSGNYELFTAKGEMPKAVADTWMKIWDKDKELRRKYTCDFEVYGDHSQNGPESEVKIFIATDKI